MVKKSFLDTLKSSFQNRNTQINRNDFWRLSLIRQNKKTKHLQYLYSACVLRDVVLLQHPVVSRMQQCMCSTGVNVGACTKINCTMRLLVQHSASQNDSSDWASNPRSHPAQDCRQASMVARVSGGSCALLGWSLSGARPPIMEGHRLFRNVTHAWIKGSWKQKALLVNYRFALFYILQVCLN